MSYDISMGVRRDNDALLKQINAILEHEQPAIDRVLKKYLVPLAPPP